jgi:hypothetical protein
VEEPELRNKFGEAYEAYREEVPLLLPKPQCMVQVLNRAGAQAAHRCVSGEIIGEDVSMKKRIG